MKHKGDHKIAKQVKVKKTLKLRLKFILMLFANINRYTFLKEN